MRSRSFKIGVKRKYTRNLIGGRQCVFWYSGNLVTFCSFLSARIISNERRAVSLRHCRMLSLCSAAIRDKAYEYSPRLWQQRQRHRKAGSAFANLVINTIANHVFYMFYRLPLLSAARELGRRKWTTRDSYTSSSAMAERPRELGDFKKARVNAGTDNHSFIGFSQVSPLPLIDPQHMVIK